MQDPKVAALVKELKVAVDKINTLNTRLYKEGVRYRLEDGYDSDTQTKVVKVTYLTQEVYYD